MSDIPWSFPWKKPETVYGNDGPAMGMSFKYAGILFKVEPSPVTSDSGRRRYYVYCQDCDDTIHLCTTGPSSLIRDHLREKHDAVHIDEQRALLSDAQLCHELVTILSQVAGDGGDSEGTADCCRRIIRERDEWRGRQARDNAIMARLSIRASDAEAAFAKATELIEQLEEEAKKPRVCDVDMAEMNRLRERVAELEQDKIANETSFAACQADREALQARVRELETVLAERMRIAAKPWSFDEDRARAVLELMDLRPEVAAFAKAMEAKLKENDHKGGWNRGEDTPDELMARLLEEAEELENALHPMRKRDPKRILREAADVANFAMMVADVCGALRGVGE